VAREPRIEIAGGIYRESQHLRLFATKPSAARRAYREFVREGIGTPDPVSDTGEELRDEAAR
jgi:hypothetical protein